MTLRREKRSGLNLCASEGGRLGGVTRRLLVLAVVVSSVLGVQAAAGPAAPSAPPLPPDCALGQGGECVVTRTDLATVTVAPQAVVVGDTVVATVTPVSPCPSQLTEEMLAGLPGQRCGGTPVWGFGAGFLDDLRSGTVDVTPTAACDASMPSCSYRVNAVTQSPAQGSVDPLPAWLTIGLRLSWVEYDASRSPGHRIVFQNADVDAPFWVVRPVETGTITIVAQAEGTAGTQDFPFTGTAPIGNFTLDNDPDSDAPDRRTFTDLQGGSYTITETVPDGWSAEGIECADPGGGTTTSIADARAVIDLAAGETVLCTFRNRPVPNEKPVAFFTSKKRDGAPLTVDLDARGSIDDHGVVDFAWTFPDGGTASGATPSHTFEEAGTYTVGLTVKDAEGLSDSIELPVEAGSSCDEGSTPTGQTSFRIRVHNRDGGPVRNVRVEAYDPCGGATELSEPTDRAGVTLLTMPYVQEDGADPVIVLTPQPQGHFEPFNLVYTEGAATATVDFTTGDTCFQRPVTVLGTEEADTLRLFSGDVLEALGGGDTVTPGPQAQAFAACGGDGGDTIDLTARNSIGDKVDGGDGQDTIATGAGPDTVLGGDARDIIVGGADDDLLYGGEGDDEIRAGAGCDGLVGDIGNDTLDASSDNDTVPVYGGCPGGGIDGGPGDDVIIGGGGADGAGGGTGCDSLLGGPGDDRLFGAADDDASWACPGGGLDGGGGNDVLDGGAGNDDVHGGANDDEVIGDTGHDQLYGDGGCDSVVGNDGNDSIFGGAGSDGPLAIGGCTNGKLDGGNGLDAIDGEGGPDLLFGGNDCDHLVGGAGGDTIDGGEGAEAPAGPSGGCNGGIIDAGGGADTVFGGGAADKIFGGDGGDTISGDGGYNGAGTADNAPDQIFGDDGSDSVYGGDEADGTCRTGDVINGGDGRDFLYGWEGGDVLVGGDGNDVLDGGGGCDDAYGGAGADTIDGGDNPAPTIELLWGEAGGDTVSGGNGADAVYGGAGRDTLSGGLGADVLDGGVLDNPLGQIGPVPPEEFLPGPPVDFVDGGLGSGNDRCAIRNDRLTGCEQQEDIRPEFRASEFTMRPSQ